ncbi:MAG TPA: lytic transglycosylase domain-containing protein [Stellaceae bacterium]|nr:lytic transglycosylase domain-containing protein [Stellaceae bacterium]
MLAVASAAAALVCVGTPALAADARQQRVETVHFADPRWPAVKVVRGGAAAAPAAAPLFRATPANSEIVTFGDGRGERVIVVRGSGMAPAAPVVARSPIETTRVASLGLPSVAVVRGRMPMSDIDVSLFAAANGGELDRVAFAIDGAESGHGINPAMWRAELDGPQGPMQVSAAAALDVGGGDRFDIRQNRLIGRAFIAKLYQRYGNWPDAIAAYNWGPGNLDRWIAGGRPVDALPLETARYLLKVLRDSLLIGPS